MHPKSADSAAIDMSPAPAGLPPLGAGTTYLVVPVTIGTERASQCRIVARAGHLPSQPASRHYASHPQLWRDVGLVRLHDGALVAFDGPAEHWQLLQDCMPLYRGMQVTADAAPLSPLVSAMWGSGDYDSLDEVYTRIDEMRAEVRAGGDPEEVLYDEGYEPDYVLELL